MPKPLRPGPRQLAVRAALEELSLVHRRLEHEAVLDHVASKLGRSSALSTLIGTSPRNFLPPGCRMTATHFEFT